MNCLTYFGQKAAKLFYLYLLDFYIFLLSLGMEMVIMIMMIEYYLNGIIIILQIKSKMPRFKIFGKSVLFESFRLKLLCACALIDK